MSNINVVQFTPSKRKAVDKCDPSILMEILNLIKQLDDGEPKRALLSSCSEQMIEVSLKGLGIR